MRAIQGGRATQAERITALEQRVDRNDKVIEPMAEQVAELYGILSKAKTINWFVVKIGAWTAGGLGFVAVVLTIAGNAAKLFGH